MRKPTGQRLSFVKTLKDVTGLGLKQAKGIIDALEYDYKNKGIAFVELEISGIEALKNFKLALSESFSDGDIEVTGGKERERSRKMLSLGIGDSDDYIGFISDSCRMKLSRNSGNLNEVLKEVLSQVDNETLIKIYNNLENEDII